MDLTVMGIMNEVDELLGKLDKLPADVRDEVMKKLSLKVSSSEGSTVQKCRGRSKGRGAARGRASVIRCDTLTDKIYVTAVPKEKTESVERIPEKISLCDAEDGSLNLEDVKIECESITRKTETCLKEDIIVTGRRSAKKCLDGDVQEENANNGDIDIKERPVIKRGRGRPRKNVISSFVNVNDSAAKEKRTISSEDTSNADQEQQEIVKTNGESSFDLLESCLKESGIKAVGEKTEEPEKDEGNEKSRTLINEKDKKLDGEKTTKKVVYVCDTLESVNNVPKKRTLQTKFKCQECGKMYSSASTLKTHQVRHRKKEDLPFACKYCDFKSASKIELFRHSLKHEKSLVYTCTICSKNFSRETGLREHIEYVHAKSQLLKCGKCEFSTHRRTTMRNHLRTHQGTVPVIACPVCGVTFRSKTNLRTHLYSHVGLKSFECNECNKKFISRNRVKAHKLHVHGPREHSCPCCEMKFPTRHALNRHILIHTGEKPFQCCFCAFTCNTQGNLIKHIRQVHEKINFTYKDFLKESRKDQQELNVDSKKLEIMQKEGKDFACKLFDTIGESLGEPLSVEQLKMEVQKKKASKVAALQEQQSKRKKRVLKKTLHSTNGKFRKVTVLCISDKSGETVVDSPVDENVYVKSGLQTLNDDSPYWLTHTDENGCLMLIPWDVSLISENDEGDEEGEWRQDLQTDKIVKVTNACINVAAGVSKNEDISISNIDDECDVGSLESALEISSDIKEEKIKAETAVSDNIMEVSELSEVVNTISPLDVDITIETSSSVHLSDKKVCKQLPKTIQVITANESVSNVSPNVSNFVFPDGYLVDDDGQVLQLTDNVMDTNLLQLQMGQVVNASEAPEVTINKITNGVYSFLNQSDTEETFVINTKEKDDETDERAFGVKPNVNFLSIEREEEEGDQQSALVLIVDAKDVDP